MAAADVLSRHNLSTRTKDHQHWDQVIGVSQGAINKQFEQLHKVHPELTKIYGSIDGIGRIDAELLPMRIMIPAGTNVVNSTDVWLHIRFKSGSVFNKQKTLDIEDLSGWIIAVRVNVKTIGAAGPALKKPTPAQIEKNRLAYEAVLKTLDGNALHYSIERLYADMGSIDWSDLNEDHSIAGVDENGDEIPLTTWISDNKQEWRHLRDWLGDWANEQDENHRTLVGVSLKLPESIGVRPTFTPTDMLHQVQAYSSPEQNVPNGTEGFTGPANANAFLYCEMVDKHPRPQDVVLVKTGNFATQASTPDSNDQIDGSLVINSGIFLQQYVLKHCQALCQATERYHYKGAISDDLGASAPSVDGWDPTHPSSEDPVYSFVNQNPTNDPDKPSFYRWSKVNAPEDAIKDSKGNDMVCRVRVKDEMTCDATWNVGSWPAKIKLSGKLRTMEYAEWYGGGENRWLCREEDLRAKSRNEYTATWSLDIIIDQEPAPVNDPNKTQSGYVLKIDIDAGPKGDGNVSGKPLINQSNIAHPDTDGSWNNGTGVRLKNILPGIINEMKKSFKGVGSFILPGNGVYSLTNPLLSKWGDLVVQVTYLPVLPDNLNIAVPKPIDGKPKAPDVSEPSKNDGSIGAPTEIGFRLTWPTTPFVVAASKQQTIALRGVNSKATPLSFKEIRITFKAKKAPKTLFFEDEFRDEGSLPKPAVTGANGNTTAPALAPVRGANGAINPTPAPESKPAPVNGVNGTAGSATTPTPAPAPAPAPVYAGGLVKFTTSTAPAAVPAKLSLLKILSKKAEDTWQATISSTSEGGLLALPPSAWLQVDITGMITSTGNWTDAVTIDEDWANSAVHWKEGVKIGAK